MTRRIENLGQPDYTRQIASLGQRTAALEGKIAPIESTQALAVARAQEAVEIASDALEAATGASYTDEQARDAVGAAFRGADGLGIAVNDAANTITVQVDTPATLFNRLGLGTLATVSGTFAAGASVSGVNTGDQLNVPGNAGTATRLATARTINGVPFDGSGNITINATDTIARQVQDADLDAISALSTQAFGRNLLTAVDDAAVRSAVNAAKSGANTDITSITGSAAKLTTARAINGQAFDGTAPITVTANWSAARTLSFTGDATGSLSTDGSANASAGLTFATVNANVGTFGSATTVPVVTVDAKGRVTAVTTATISGGGGSGGDMFKADNLSGLANYATARSNLGATTVGNAVFTATDAAAGRSALGAGTGNGTVTSVVGTAPIVSDGSATSPAISINPATTTAPGSLAAADKVKLNALSGTNTGDQTITLTGDVTGSGTGSFAATIGANKVTFAKVVAASAASVVGATAAGNFAELTPAQGRSVLGLGTAALANTGTSGATVPLLDGTNTWSNAQAFSGTVTINGDLTVNGTTTTIDATQLNVADPIISVARNNSTGAVSYAGIRMVRGSAGNAAYFVYDEATDVWVAQTAADDAQASAVQVPLKASQLISTVATGTAPFAVTSTTAVPNLSIGGNASTATTLQTARTINGQSFNGSANITVTANWNAARTLSYTGDATGSLSTDGSANASAALTLATVNTNTGSFGSASTVPTFTVNGKGLITAASSVAVNDTTKQPLTTPYLTPASTASAAGLRAPHGTAPTSPVNGDVWTTTAGLFVRINGVTVGPLAAGGGLRQQTITVYDANTVGNFPGIYTAVQAETLTVYSYGATHIYQKNTVAAPQTFSSVDSIPTGSTATGLVLAAGESLRFVNAAPASGYQFSWVHVRQTA